MPRTVHFTRSLAILRMRHQLERESYPRIQMAFIVTLTGAAGLLFSFLMLRAGVESMAFRYPLALAAAYMVFLLQLWLWLRTKADDYLDLPDFADMLSSQGTGGASPPIQSGVGGDFGGGGASGSYEEPLNISLAESNPVSGLGDVAEVDELAIPILAIVLALGLALASLYVVYLAPMLFAELLVDGALSYALYRHLRRTDNQHWLATAVRRTALPFALTAVFLGIVGAAMAVYAPGAHTVGEVVHHAGSR